MRDVGILVLPIGVLTSLPGRPPSRLSSQPVDTIDRRLLDLLRTNARLSFAELARQVGLSPPAVHDRVAKLESSGVIQGYRTVVEPESIGLGVTALVGIVHSDESELDEVAAALSELPEVESCYFL